MYYKDICILTLNIILKPQALHITRNLNIPDIHIPSIQKHIPHILLFTDGRRVVIVEGF